MSRNRIDWTRFDAFLGEVPDAKIAELAGCSKVTVAQRRESKGIEPYDPTTRPKGPDWSKVRAWLGKVPDRVVARELGVSRALVSEYRAAQGITSYQSKLRSEE